MYTLKPYSLIPTATFSVDGYSYDVYQNENYFMFMRAGEPFAPPSLIEVCADEKGFRLVSWHIEPSYFDNVMTQIIHSKKWLEDNLRSSAEKA